jgi:transposase-like protein
MRNERLGQVGWLRHDEARCAAYLAWRRWPDGFVCPVCSSRRVSLLKTRPLYECLGCGRQTSITAGTVMHQSKLPLPIWFEAALCIVEGNGSVTTLSKNLRIPYKTAWAVMNRFRTVMNNRLLTGYVEIAYEELYLKGNRRLRSECMIAAALELGSLEVRLAAIADDSALSIDAFLDDNVLPNATRLRSEDLEEQFHTRKWQTDLWAKDTPPRRLSVVFTSLLNFRRKPREPREEYLKRFTKYHNESIRQISFKELIGFLVTANPKEN